MDILFHHTPVYTLQDAQLPTASSSSSSSGATSATLEPCTKRIHDAYHALRNLSYEHVPPSCPSSPSSEARTEALRDKVKAAWDDAGGDPSSGKWAHVVWALKLGCTTAKYRYVAAGRRTQSDRESSEIDARVLALPALEEDWLRLDKEMAKRRKGVHMMDSKRKGKSKSNGAWKRGADSQAADLNTKIQSGRGIIISDMPSVPKASAQGQGDIQEANVGATTKGKTRESKKTPSLGFPVVKRSSFTPAAAKKGKTREFISSATNVGAEPVPTSAGQSAGEVGARQKPSCSSQDKALPSIQHPTTVSQGGITLDGPFSSPNKETAPRMSDLSEMSFLPPSFPSQLETSTPQPQKEMRPEYGRAKPPSIPFIPFPSSPPSSPHLSNSLPYPRMDHQAPGNSSSSQPLAYPTKVLEKRRRPLTPPDDVPASINHKSSFPLVKRAKTMLAPGSSIHPPTTPPESSMPSSDAHINAGGFSKQRTPERQLPTLTALLASSRKSKPRQRRSDRRVPNGPPPAEVSAVGQGVTRPRTPVRENPSPAKSFSSLGSGSPESPVSHHPVRSPISPMFSQNVSKFAPPYFSTQQPHFGLHSSGAQAGTDDHNKLARGSSGFFGTGYNSQFDVERQVDHVSELLERDVDFDIWLKDLVPADMEAVSEDIEPV